MILLDRLLEQFPKAKRQTLKRMIEDGRVTVNGATAVKLKQPVEEGDVVRVGRAGEAEKKGRGVLPFRVVFEDGDLLVVDKPAGLLTSTTARETRTTALALVEEYVGQNEPAARVGLIHRLDRDASGLLVFSKNDGAYQGLKGQFFHHTVKRIYSAIVSPAPEPAHGRIESNLAEWADGTVHSARMRNRGRAAVTEYHLIQSAQSLGMVQVQLHTGRKHQIRAHLSEKGWPILGDKVYGGLEEQGLMLAATELGVDHPRTGVRMEFKIELPARMNDLMERIRNG